MSSFCLSKSFFVLSFCALFLHTALAHNGALTYAYPMQSIEVDADLSDWPANLTKNPISFYQYGFKPENEDDIRGYYIIGYNEALQEVYVGVEMIDDAYVRNEENPAYWAHDMQVLYIDPQHKSESTGVFALEVNEYFRKIVDQKVNWDPFVLNSSWDMVDVKAKRYDDKTIYEWKIKLDGYIQKGRTIGFDYVVFDKDSKDGNSNTVGWGPDEGIKHECSACLGDVLLISPETKLASISGKVGSDRENILPGSVNIFSTGNPDQFVSSKVDSLGNFMTKLPYGDYYAEVPSGLIEEDEKLYRMEGNNQVDIIAGSSAKTGEVKIVESKVLPQPDLIPAEGLLHNFDDESEAALHQIIESYQTYYAIPGISLVLIKDGKLFYHKTYGLKNKSTNEPVDDRTLFEAASITKPVFAYVVLRLAERGEIDLDKPLAEYLPFDDLKEYPEYKKMTARHVLTHRTGLPNWGREMKFTPGEKYGYSGEGFEYLKRVVVHITGKPVEEHINDELKIPLKIQRMQFKETATLPDVAATGHINDSPVVRILPQESGMAWSMYTEAADFSKFALALLDRKGLKASTFEEMMTIHSAYPEDWWVSKNYTEGMGLGISLRESEYGKVFGHSGNNGDFKCLFEVFADQGMGYIIFTNSNTGDALNDDMVQILIEGKRVSEDAMTGDNK